MDECEASAAAARLQADALKAEAAEAEAKLDLIRQVQLGAGSMPCSRAGGQACWVGRGLNAMLSCGRAGALGWGGLTTNGVISQADQALGEATLACGGVKLRSRGGNVGWGGAGCRSCAAG
eukprot:214491-Chlamydomonas_euryale.AAC.1